MGTNFTAAPPVDALAEFATPEFRRDPHHFLRWLREHEPVHRTSRGFYLVSTHADASWVLRNPDGVFRAPDQEQLAEQFPHALKSRTMALLLTSLPSLNPPAHTRLRRLVARDFTPRRVDGLRERISVVCDRLLDRVDQPLRDGAVIDLYRLWARPLSIRVISELLGVPEGDQAWLAERVSGFTTALGGGSAELLVQSDGYVADLRAYFDDLVADLRRTPRDGLLSTLAQAHEGDSDVLDDDDLFSVVWALWVAGFDSTASGIAHGVLAAMAHPDQRRWLRGDHSDALAFADEVMRHGGGPVLFPSSPRIATQDVELSGSAIVAGSDVRPLLAAANRDPAVFADPDRFEPARDKSAALAFSQGIHHCLGAFLARTEMAVGLARLYARFADLVCVAEPKWKPSPGLRSLLELKVALADTNRKTGEEPK